MPNPTTISHDQEQQSFPRNGVHPYEGEWERVIAPNLAEIRQSLERGGGGPDDEAHWALVRKQFTFDHERGHLNTETIGASPLYVRRKTEGLRERYEQDPWHETGRVSGEATQAVEKIAALLNVYPEELSFTSNVTQSLLHVADGLQLRRGDLVVTTDHEHHGGRFPWDRRRDWGGLVIEEVPIVKAVQHAEGLNEETIALFRSTLERLNTPRFDRKRKLLSISHIFSPLGRKLPVKQLCALAREYGYLSYLDGAQTVGMIGLDLHDLDCDFYGNSPHKWLLAPKGTGLLYTRKESVTQLKGFHTKSTWKAWHDGAPTRAFSTLGTVDPAALCGIGFAVDFLDLIGGIDRVEERGWHLACRLRDGIAQVPGLRLITPLQSHQTVRADRVSASLTSWLLEGAGNFGERLRSDYDISFPFHDQWARLSTHYYNTPAQIDRVIHALREIASG